MKNVNNHVFHNQGTGYFVSFTTQTLYIAIRLLKYLKDP